MVIANLLSLLVFALTLVIGASTVVKENAIESKHRITFPVKYALANNARIDTPLAAFGFLELLCHQVINDTRFEASREVNYAQWKLVLDYLEQKFSPEYSRTIVRIINRSTFLSLLNYDETIKPIINMENFVEYISSALRFPSEIVDATFIMDHISDCLRLLLECNMEHSQKLLLSQILRSVLGPVNMPTPLSNNDVLDLEDKSPFDQNEIVAFSSIDDDELFSKFISALKVLEDHGFGQLQEVVERIMQYAKGFENDLSKLQRNVLKPFESSFYLSAVEVFQKDIILDPIVESIIIVVNLFLQRTYQLKVLNVNSFATIMNHPFEAINHVKSLGLSHNSITIILQTQREIHNVMKFILNSRYFSDCQKEKHLLFESIEQVEMQCSRMSMIIERFGSGSIPTNIPVKVRRYFEHSQWYPHVFMSCLDHIIQDPIVALNLRIYFDRQFLNMLSTILRFPEQEKPRLESQKQLLNRLSSFPVAQNILKNYFVMLNGAIKGNHFKLSVELATPYSGTFGLLTRQFALLSAVIQEHPDDIEHIKTLFECLLQDFAYLFKYYSLDTLQKGYLIHIKSKLDSKITKLQALYALKPKIISDQERQDDTFQMNNYLRDSGFFETRDEKRRRESVFQKLSLACEFFVHEIANAKSIPEQACFSRLVSFGSYSLNVHDVGADIDTLLVVPEFISSDEFFKRFPSSLKRYAMYNKDDPNKSLQIEYMNGVPAGFTPVMNLIVDKVAIDMVFARSRVSHPTDDDLRIFETYSILEPPKPGTTFGNSQYSSNGYRTTEFIKTAVPNRDVYRSALRCIKMWAKRRGLYGGVYGYLNGVACAIMVANVCIQNPFDAANVIVSKFFETYLNWNWPEPVLLQPLSFHFDHARNAALMPVTTPALPEIVSTYNVSRSTKEIIMKELERAHKVFQPYPIGNDSYNELLKSARADFFKSYPWYFKIDGEASAKEFLSFKDFLKSRLRLMVTRLESYTAIEVAVPFPEGIFTESDMNAPVSVVDKKTPLADSNSSSKSPDATPPQVGLKARRKKQQAEQEKEAPVPVQPVVEQKARKVTFFIGMRLKPDYPIPNFLFIANEFSKICIMKDSKLTTTKVRPIAFPADQLVNYITLEDQN